VAQRAAAWAALLVASVLRLTRETSTCSDIWGIGADDAASIWRDMASEVGPWSVAWVPQIVVLHHTYQWVGLVRRGDASRCLCKISPSRKPLTWWKANCTLLSKFNTEMIDLQWLLLALAKYKQITLWIHIAKPTQYMIINNIHLKRFTFLFKWI